MHPGNETPIDIGSYPELKGNNSASNQPTALPTLRQGWTSKRLALAVAFIVLGLFLRGWKFDRIPHRGATIDEYAWTWSGLSLITKGEPHAWSYLNGYDEVKHVEWKGRDCPMVKPWMDHPPLFSLWMGLWVRAHGTTELFDVRFIVMRRMPLILSAFTLVLLTMLIAQSHGVPIALISLLFYATWPPCVQHNRLVISENFFMLFAFVGMLALDRLISGSRHRGWLVALAIASICLPLIKLVACSFCLVLLARAAEARRSREAAVIAGSTAVGFGLYVIYGVTFGGETFWRLLVAQKDRFIGFMGWRALMFGYETVHHSIPWLPLLAGVVLAFWLPSRSRSFSWAAAVPIYIMAMTFFVKDNEVYGWYFIPLYPFACAAVAERAFLAWRQRDLRATWLLFLIGWIAMFSNLWSHSSLARLFKEPLRFGFIGVAVVAMLSAMVCRPTKGATQVGLAAGCAVALTGAFVEVFSW